MLTFTFYSYSLLGNNIHFIHHDRNRLDHKPINSVLQLVGVQHVDFTSRPSVIHVWHYIFSQFQMDLGTWPEIWECHILVQCLTCWLTLPSLWGVEVKWSEFAPSCLTLWDPLDYSPPGSSICGIFLARILEWVAISFSRGSSLPRDWNRVSCIVGRCFTIWATREVSWNHKEALYHWLNSMLKDISCQKCNICNFTAFKVLFYITIFVKQTNKQLNFTYTK